MGEQFQNLEDARSRLLKEEADYRDALSAYMRAIGTPRQLQAGQTLDREEAEYRAIDEAVATYTQKNCSVSNYTAEKVYEYYAALEMVYKLATDAAFRESVVARIEELFQGGFLGNYMAANRILDHVDSLYESKPDGLSYGLEWLFGNDESYAKLEQYDANIEREINRLERIARGYRDEAFRALGAYFASVWQQIKAKYHDCGLLYAVTVAGIDGAFLAAEIGVGVSFLRGLKFVRRILPDGKLAVDVTDIEGRRLGSANWSREALEAKYGTPQDNHVGGFEPDTNRQIPDKSADDVLKEKRANEDRSERQDERADGSYRNPKDPDGVRRAPDGEAMVEENGEWKRISETSNNTKGRFGETMADHWAANQDPPWEKVNGPASAMNTPGHQGLDSVYRNPNPPPDYFVTDAKYGSAALGRLKDGTQQMSPDWIKERLDQVFSRAEANRINRSHEPGILRVDKDGNVIWERLKNRTWRKVIASGGR